MPPLVISSVSLNLSNAMRPKETQKHQQRRDKEENEEKRRRKGTREHAEVTQIRRRKRKDGLVQEFVMTREKRKVTFILIKEHPIRLPKC